jgi:hypothetical protein
MASVNLATSAFEVSPKSFQEVRMMEHTCSTKGGFGSVIGQEHAADLKGTSIHLHEERTLENDLESLGIGLCCTQLLA